MNGAVCIGMRLSGDRAAGACSSAHVPRAGRDRPSSFTSLRSKPHRPDPIHRFGIFSVTQRARRKPGTSGWGRSEVKGEGRVFSGPEDMSGVPRPMATARASRHSKQRTAASPRWSN